MTISFNVAAFYLFESPIVSFLRNPMGFLTSHGKGANWLLFFVVAVIFLGAWVLLMKAGKAWLAAQRRGKSTSAFPGDENAFRAIFEESSVGCALLDKDGRVLHGNRAMQKIFSMELGGFIGLPFSNLAHPEDAHSDKSHFAELVEGKRARYRLERRFYDAEGQILWLREEVFGAGIGGFVTTTPGTRAVILLEDVTRRKMSEDELFVTREAIHNLYQVIVDRHLDLLEKMSALLAMGCRRFNVETGVLGEVIDSGFEILQVSSPDERIRRGKTYERSAELGDWPEPVFARHTRLPESDSPHLARDWRRFPFYGIADVEVFLSAPIFVNGELFGAICFSGVTPRDEDFSAADKEFLQLMAQWLGAELERLQAQAELEAKQHELMKANAQLEALATVDGLTGAKNRRALEEQLEMELRRAFRYKTPLSLLMIDVDKFKQYNDSYGHPAGDLVLRSVADILSKNVRVIDFVARYGGEEFSVLLPQTDVEGAMIVANRLCAKIEGASWPQRPVTASFGVATITDDMKERADLISAADRALYFSKEAGRNRATHVQHIAAEAPATEEAPAPAK